MRRLYLPLPPLPPDELELTGAPFHHLVTVLRGQAGDALELFDGQGHAWAARILELGPTSVRVARGEALATEAPSRSIVLLQGMPKADKLEWVLQKGTELGASGFLPVVTERSVVKLAPERDTQKRERWQKIVEEAARQCGRSDVPKVHVAQRLLDAVKALEPGVQLLVLDEEERTLRLSAVEAVFTGAPLALLVGPEGGLTREEVASLRGLGAVPVTLGRLVLRSETAGLAALTVMRHLEGLLG